MMGRLNRDQGQLFYEFRLEDAVPADHLARKIARVLDLSWVMRSLRPIIQRRAVHRLTQY
jgi:hypothetical protein